jgi:protein-tyrosine kinase
MWPLKKKSPVVGGIDDETRDALRSLAQRLSLNAGEHAPRVVAFIAARTGEGTSTLALQYTALLSHESGKHILLIDGSSNVSKVYADVGLTDREGIIDAALSGQPLESALHEIMPGFSVARWVGNIQNRAVSDRIMQNPEFWKKLQSAFGCVIVDAPSLQASFDGVVLAAKAEATIMVVEAESTPVPVAQKLRDTLTDAGAKIAGVVLTKRRYYIPQGVYNKL